MGTRVLTILNHITVKNGDRPGTRFELRCYLPGDAEGTVVATEFGQYLLIPSWQAVATCSAPTMDTDSAWHTL